MNTKNLKQVEMLSKAYKKAFDAKKILFELAELIQADAEKADPDGFGGDVSTTFQEAAYSTLCEWVDEESTDCAVGEDVECCNEVWQTIIDDIVAETKRTYVHQGG